MVFMLVAGVMSFIAVTRVLLVLFCVRKCLVVLDYGGYNMAHPKVLHKKLLHALGHVKQVENVQVRVELSLIQVRQLVKINKRQKRFFHNHCVHPHHQAVQIQERADRQELVMVSL